MSSTTLPSHRDYDLGKIPANTRRTFRKILSLQSYYIKKGTLPPSGAMLFTTGFICRSWDMAPRTLERHLSILKANNIIKTERAGADGKRYLTVMPPTGRKQLDLFLDAPIPVPIPDDQAAILSISFQAPQWESVATGTGPLEHVYINGTATYTIPSAACPETSAEPPFEGQMAGPVAVGMAEPHLITDYKENIDPSPYPLRTDGPKILSMKNTPTPPMPAGSDPVLERLNSRSPSQSASEAAEETAHMMKKLRLSWLRQVQNFTAGPLKSLYRNERAKYDCAKRLIVGDPYRFGGGYLDSFYKLLEKMAEYLINRDGSTNDREMAAFAAAFLDACAKTQNNLSPDFLHMNFAALTSVIAEARAKELKKEDGLDRSPSLHPALSTIPGALDDDAIGMYCKIFEKYRNMRVAARTENTDMDEDMAAPRAKQNILALTEHLAKTCEKAITKNGSRKEDLFVLMERFMRYWMHFKKFSTWYFSKCFNEALDTSVVVRKKREEDLQRRIAEGNMP